MSKGRGIKIEGTPNKKTQINKKTCILFFFVHGGVTPGEHNIKRCNHGQKSVHGVPKFKREKQLYEHQFRVLCSGWMAPKA